MRLRISLLYTLNIRVDLKFWLWI